jgi:hypothetical protein
MTMSDGLQALRRANPRAMSDLDASVDAVAAAVRSRIEASATLGRDPAPLRRFGRVSLAGAALVVAAAAAVLSSVGSPGGGGGVESAAAAVQKAAALTASSARESGSAVVRITHDGQAWAGSTISWHDDDLSVRQDTPGRDGRPGSALLVVGGTLYGVEDGAWVVLGSPRSVDPDSGTTPYEYLAAVREDAGGASLRRIVEGMSGLTRLERADGSVVYRGAVPAGLIARETGFKEGQSIRGLPFGYVVHGEAANPSALLDAAVTVDDDVIREIAVRWDNGWTYTVTYSGLGATPSPVAPAKAKPLRRGATGLSRRVPGRRKSE